MILDTLAQYKRMVSARTALALRKKRANGEVYGTVPYGFMRDGDRLEPHDGERRILATMRELRDGCGVTWREMAEQLNRDGFTTRRGTPWTLHVARSAYMTATKGHCNTEYVRLWRRADPARVSRNKRNNYVAGILRGCDTPTWGDIRLALYQWRSWQARQQ